MSTNKSNFPTSAWNGDTPTRTSREVDRQPDYEDWDQLVAEMIATQEYIVNGHGQAAIASLTNSTGGTTDGTLQALPGDTTANNATAANNNFAELHVKVDAILVALRTAGIILT